MLPSVNVPREARRHVSINASAGNNDMVHRHTCLLPHLRCPALPSRAATAATDPTAAMASPTVLTFDAEGPAVDFDVWVDDLQLFLQCDSRDGVSLFDHTSGVSTAPAATADSTVCSQYTPLRRPVAVSLADPSGGPVLAHSSTVLSCPAAPSGLLPGLHLPSFSTNLVSGADLQDAWVDQSTPGGQRVTHCTCSRTARHLATFTRRPGSSLYTLTTAPPPVPASGQVVASSQVFAAASRSSPVSAPYSCRPLAHETLLWHHRLGHPSLPRLRGMASRALVSGLPRSLPPLPPGPAPTCVPCVEGRQRAAPHTSSFPPTEAPLQTLHMDVWGPARVRGQGHERYFLLVVDDYSRYTTVFPLRSKGEVPEVLIDWIRGARRQLSESFGSDLPVLRLHSDRGGEFSSDLMRAFCRSEGIRQTFTLPASPQQNGIAERRIGMVMDVARTSMIHAAAPHFLWPFAVQYAAHQINLQPRVSLPETTHTLRWTGKVGDAFAFRVWGSRAFVRDTTADKLSSRAVPCVFLGFPPDAPGWQFYHPTSPAGGAAGTGATGSAASARAAGGAAGAGAVGGVAGAGATGGAAGAEAAGGAAGAGAAGGAAGAGAIGGAAGAGAAGGAAGAGVAGGVAGTGDPGAEGTGSVPAVSRGAARPRTYYVPLLQQVLGSLPYPGPPPPSLSPPPVPSQSQLQPASPLPGLSPYSGPTRGLTERREHESRLASPVRSVCTGRVSRPRPPPVPGTHSMTLRPSTAPQRVPLPSPPASSLPAGLDSTSVCPPSVGGECALSTDVLEDRQEEFECFAASVLHLAAMDAKMASWKSTVTYVDKVPPPGANIVSGMWIFRVKRLPGSPPVFKARYVARGFNDLVFAIGDTEALAHVKSELQKRHTCTDLGELTSYLGLRITRDRAQRTITLTQSHMVQQVLQRFGFTYSSPQSTPLPTGHSLSAPPSDEFVEPSGPYPELVGCLMHRKVHWDAAERVLRYLCSTSGMGLVLGGRARVVLTGHADASWELRWLTYLLTDLGEAPRSPPVQYVNNKAMLALCQEHRLEHRTKHIALRYFLARELQQRGQLRLAYGAGSGGAEPEGVEPGGAESEGAESGGAEPRGAASSGAPGAGEPGDTGAGGAAVTTGAGDPTEPGGAGAGGAGAGVAEVGGPGAGGAGAAGAGVGGTSTRGDGAVGAGAVDPGARGARGTVRPCSYFVPLLQQVLGVPSSTGLPPPFPCPPPDQTQPPLQPASPLPATSPYTEQSGGLTERREPASRHVWPVYTARRAPRSRPPPVPGTHAMALRPSSIPLRVPLPASPESSLPEVPDPESDRPLAASPTVAHLLATTVADPSFESAAASALVAELLDFAAACHLDYASTLRHGCRDGILEVHRHLRPRADPSVFLRTETSLPPFYVLVYVDDLVFATADTEALTLVKSELQKRHTCTDLGELCSYLSLQITRDRARRTVTLTKSDMVHHVLQRFGFQYSSPQLTPLSTSHLLSAPPSDESVEPSGPYPELVGCLITSGMGLVLGGRGPAVLTGHADASWVDDSATQRSNCEAEIYARAMAAQELRCLTYLLTDLGEQPRLPPVLYVDNKAMIALCQEHRLEHRTKHIAQRYFLAQELQQRGQLCLAYVATRANTADVFT
ncbi:unnamed protein product [Closterium sp. NIES-54]